MASSREAQELAISLKGVNLTDSVRTGMELFAFDNVKRGWHLLSNTCEAQFYDASFEGTSAAVWFIEIPECEVDVAVSDELNMQMEDSELRVTFCTPEGVWALRFPTFERFSFFRKTYFDKLFENMYGCENTEANQAAVYGKDLAGRLFAFTDPDSAPMDWDLTEEEIKQEDVPSPLEVKKETIDKTPTAISSIQMGVGDKSYLFRGNEVDVLTNKTGSVGVDGVTFKLLQPGGAIISPAKVLLGQHEKRMSILTEEDKSTLFHADVETGKVVTEWKFEKNGVDVPMLDIAGEFKGVQSEENSTVLSLDKNRLCRWDVRDPSGVVEDMSAGTVLSYQSGKDYSKGTNFTCMASAGDGSVAVGSADGRIRLYNSNQKLGRATTSLTPSGSPITAIDVTYDGQWVIATTDGFIQVARTSCKDDQGNVINGYKKSLSKWQPLPKLLKLKPEDQAALNRQPLRNAKFTFITEANRQERLIVASCGNYTILWNFRQVKLSKSSVKSHGGLTTITDYRMLEKTENVVDSSFMHDKYVTHSGGDALVIATDHCLYTALDE